MTRTYAIGDIHGHLDKLHEAHALIAADRAACGDTGAPIVHVGDLVDRGPDSRGVIQYLMEGVGQGENWIVLKGNHDRMAEMFWRDYPAVDHMLLLDFNWFHARIGGIETMESYGVRVPAGIRTYQLHAQTRAAVPEAHRDFLHNLPTFYRRGPQYFAHAGIRPGVSLEAQTEDDLLWIREEFHDSTDDHGPLIIHGHTPVDAVTHYGNRVNLDTGAAYGKALSTVVIEDRDVWLLGENGRTKVPARAT